MSTTRTRESIAFALSRASRNRPSPENSFVICSSRNPFTSSMNKPHSLNHPSQSVSFEQSDIEQPAVPVGEEPIPDTLRMITPDDAARATLNGAAGNLGRDELRVLTRIAERLQAGRLVYGPLF